MWNHNMGNDSMRSIMIPQGVSVTLYDNDSWGGSTEVMSGKYTDSKENMACQNLSSLDKKVSSIEVKNTNSSYSTAIGYWVNAASGESASFTVSTTFTTSKGSSHTSEE